MDREKVAAGITQKYKELLPFIPGLAFSGSAPGSQAASLYFGYSYLEKFIQLSFTLPVISDPELLIRFLSSISRNATRPTWLQRLRSSWSFKEVFSSRKSPHDDELSPKASAIDTFNAAQTGLGIKDVEQQKRVEYLRVKVEKDSDQILQIVSMVSAIFENNPRKLKQFINTFRLSLFLSSSQGVFDREEGSASVTPEQLGKFVAITLRFPDLRSKLASNLNLLDELEDAARESKDVSVGSSLGIWLEQRGVREVLVYGIKLGRRPFDDRTFSLKRFPVKKMMSILPTVPEKPNQSVSPGAISASAQGTSSVSATINLPVEVSSAKTSPSPESQAGQEPRNQFPSETSQSISDVQMNDDRVTADTNWQRIHSLLSPLNAELREAYQEALRILLRDGEASETFVLGELQQRKLALNWGGIFIEMQRATNLVQPVPGQSDRVRQEDKEWQIRPALRGPVASYLRRHAITPQA
jgi:hypothetical protein